VLLGTKLGLFAFPGAGRFGLIGGTDLKFPSELISGFVGLLGMGGTGKLDEFVNG
jgi:hypothetical protein